MNLYEAIQRLYAQKKELESVIASLEKLRRTSASSAPSTLKRRGRRSMGSAEREEVSKRMKKYWASRRKQRDARPDLSSPALTE